MIYYENIMDVALFFIKLGGISSLKATKTKIRSIPTQKKKKKKESPQESIRARLVDCNDDYIGIGIYIIRDARCCNVIIIRIQLFGSPIIIEP